MVNTNIYEPSHLVKLMHSSPHLNEAFRRVPSDFTYANTDYEDYFISISVLPAILAGVGLVAVIILQLVITVRCCFCRRPARHAYDPVYEASQEALMDFLNDNSIESP